MFSRLQLGKLATKACPLFGGYYFYCVPYLEVIISIVSLIWRLLFLLCPLFGGYYFYCVPYLEVIISVVSFIWRFYYPTVYTTTSFIHSFSHWTEVVMSLCMYRGVDIWTEEMSDDVIRENVA